MNAALEDAFGSNPEAQLQNYLTARGGPRSGAVLGQYLPIMSPSVTPRSLALVESDELVGVAQQALGTNAPIAKPAKAVRYVSPSGWHRDCGTGVRAVKIIYYLESADEITFQLVPTSHLPVVERVVRKVVGEKGGGEVLGCPLLPTMTIRLGRHQAMIFDVALWHRNPSDAERVQWSITYMAEPQAAEELDRTVSFIGSFFGKHPTYDQGKFPFYPVDWINGTSESLLAGSLVHSGVMRQFVDRYGEFL